MRELKESACVECREGPGPGSVWRIGIFDFGGSCRREKKHTPGAEAPIFHGSWREPSLKAWPTQKQKRFSSIHQTLP